MNKSSRLKVFERSLLLLRLLELKFILQWNFEGFKYLHKFDLEKEVFNNIITLYCYKN